MLIPQLLRAEGEYCRILSELSARRAAGARFAACGLCDGAAQALFVTLCTDLKQKGAGTVLVFLPEEKECTRLVALLSQYGLRAAFFTERDLTFYNISASHEYEYGRVRVLWGLCRGDFDVIVTTPDAALGFTVSQKRLEEATVRLAPDSVVEPSALAARLSGAGYVRVGLVEGPGQFAVRGGIIDVYAPHIHAISAEGESLSCAAPLRIELFGDEIDRMGLFDIDTQRISTPIKECEIPPAREVMVGEEDRARVRAAVAAQLARCKEERAKEELAAELAQIDGGEELRFADKYISLIEPEKPCLLSYFSHRCVVILRGTNALRDRLRAAQWHRDQRTEELLQGGTVAAKYAQYAYPEASWESFLEKQITLHADSIAEGLSGMALEGLYTFRTKHTVAYGDNFALLEEDLTSFVQTKQRVLLLAENETSAKNLQGILSEKGFSARLAADTEEALWDYGKIVVSFCESMRGFELPASRAVVLSMTEGRYEGSVVAKKLRRAKKKKDARGAILSYADLQPGDLVVHESHGIGRYVGLETLTIDGVTRDYISIQYAGTDQLFLPCDRLESVSKYIGAHADDGLVKLSRFGGGDWKKAKARAKAAVKDMAKDLIRLYAERARREGFAFPADDDYQRDFEAAFAFEETEGQISAAEDIKQDMMRSVPMDRLLCGDVGFGKTEVALRAAYKAILAGKQVAILVPTTILALQHFSTIQARMHPFAVRADMISRFRTPKQQQQSLRRLARGDVDIIVGTHRLVSKDVKFHDLGLLIVDEEQRFGVAQKEKLKQLAGNVDVLTLTATPIPRTLNMAMSGIRDISILDEAPGDRLPVQSYVLEHDPLIVEEAIRRELRRGGQVFYLHNAVETIREVAARLSSAIPEARITVAHGQMDKDELERIWSDMIKGEIDILVSTTIIETGVDVPNANTLIVDNAHRMGLSQLHQLRGRVGRSARRAYAYFTYPRGRALADIQRKRLEAIREYTEFGAGFRIALRDLELRGAGNLLGAEQHGHLDAVGYDLYVKLLNEAVLEERGEVIREKKECVVNLSFDACLPEKYVPSAPQRMALYKRISLITSQYDLEDMTDELLDRYGDLPRAAQNLLLVALIRSLAEQCGMKSIRQEGAIVLITPEEPEVDVWMQLSDRFTGRLRMILSGVPQIRFRADKGATLLGDLRDLFLAYLEIKGQKG